MNSIPIEQIIGFLENRLSAEEKQKLESWISESDENKTQFDEIKKLFENSEKFKIDFQPNPQAALNKVNRTLGRKRFIRWSQRAAAAMLLLFLISKVVFWISPKPEWIEITAQNQQEILLADSSKVVLAQNANFRYPKNFNKKERIVILNGKAYFEIKTNSKSPFTVNTFNTKTTVLGTKFLVDAANPTQEKVIVDEGKVSFVQINQNQTHVIYLTENEIGTWDANNNSISESIVSERNINSLLSGRMEFDDNTLSEVISDFQRIYEIQIELADKSMDILKYTGTFNNIEPEKALETIAFTLSLVVEKSNKTYILKK